MVLHSRGKVRVLKLRLKDSDTKHFECYLIFWNFTRKGRCTMFPLINKRETGVNLRRIMDMRGNRAPIVSDIIAKPLDARERRLRAYYEKLNEKYVA